MTKSVEFVVTNVTKDALLRELKILVNGHNVSVEEMDLAPEKLHNCYFVNNSTSTGKFSPIMMIMDEAEDQRENILIDLGDKVNISNNTIKVYDGKTKKLTKITVLEETAK